MAIEGACLNGRIVADHVGFSDGSFIQATRVSVGQERRGSIKINGVSTRHRRHGLTTREVVRSWRRKMKRKGGAWEIEGEKNGK